MCSASKQQKERLRAWSLLLLAAMVRSFARMPLGISDRNTIIKINTDEWKNYEEVVKVCGNEDKAKYKKTMQQPWQNNGTVSSRITWCKVKASITDHKQVMELLPVMIAKILVTNELRWRWSLQRCLSFCQDNGIKPIRRVGKVMLCSWCLLLLYHIYADIDNFFIITRPIYYETD